MGQQELYKKLAKSDAGIPGTIYEVETFSTWWNKNLATVVSYYDSYYRVFLVVARVKKESGGWNVVYEGADVSDDSPFWSYVIHTFPHDHSCNWWGECSRGKHNSPSSSKSEASWLRRELSKGYGKYHDNPILLIHPDCDLGGKYFHEIVTEPYVVKKEVGVAHNSFASFRVGDVDGEMDGGIRPFDVIKVLKKDETFDIVPYYHVGVYLGNREVFHYHDEDRKEWAKARIDSIETFLKGNNVHGHLIIYHPIIPFRHWEKAFKNVDWAVNNKYGRGYYDKFERNCEHLANSVVYGINHSEQVSKWKSFCLRSKINEVDGELKELDNRSARDIQGRIEVPPKSSCGIM